MHIAAVGECFPRHYFDQAALTAELRRRWGKESAATQRLERFHENVRVQGRHLCLSLAEYDALTSIEAANETYLRCAPRLAQGAVEDALALANVSVERVDHLFFVTVTGIATPSVDARLMNRLPFREDTKRTPIFGLGCVAGAAGIARAADYVRAYPDQVALLVSVELCSLTFQAQDRSIRNLIATGLFGDGAAAVVVTGADAGRDGPRVVATRSVFYPDSEDVMGWDVGPTGFRIVLSAAVPDFVRRHLRDDVDHFLADHGLSRADVRSWICHPGGPRVLEAMGQALEITDDDLAITWSLLERCGNLSSASVLLVLRETMERRRPEPGTPGVMIAMGPGFCTELVLLEW